MTTSSITRNRLSAIADEGFGGALLYPGDAGYDEARTVSNAMIDRYPLAIVRCRTDDDVAATVRAVRRDDVDLTVRAGGHGVTGAAVADDAVCIDLREMARIDIDPIALTARVEAGALWRDLDAASQAHGLAVTGGRVSTTGVAGLALGSGSGWLERAFGYTGDSLLSAEVVTADGRLVRASEREHPGLFWGVRGGSGNFGIVTAFHFRLHRVGPTVMAGMLLYDVADARAVVRNYRDVLEPAPDELCGGVVFMTAEWPGVPHALRGRPVVAVVCCHAGPMEQADEVLRPLREFGTPRADTVAPMPYVDVQQLFDRLDPAGACHHWSGDFLAELPDDAVDALTAHATTPVSPRSTVMLAPGGGAAARVDQGATAMGDRSARWNLHYISMWSDPADTAANVVHARAMSAALAPWTTGRAYLNYLGDDDGRAASAYGPDQYARLAALKRTWDPDNVFRHNPNIPPADADHTLSSRRRAG